MPTVLDHTRNGQPRGKPRRFPNRAQAAFAAGLILWLIGCDARGPQHRAQNQPLRVGVITPTASQPAAASYRAALDRYASRVPTVRLSWFTPADSGVASMEASLKSAREAGIEAVVAFVDSEDAAQRITFAGLPSATFGPVEGSGAGCGHVYLDYPDAAEQLGRQLVDLAPDARSYVLLHRESAGGWHERAYRRFIMQADRGRLRRLSQRDLGTSPPEEARDAVDSMFSEFPAAPLVVSLDPSPWVVGPSRPLGEGRRFISIGSMPALWPFIEDGSALAIAGPLESAAADTALRLVCDCLNDTQRQARLRTQGPEIVTRESLDEFSKRFNGE